MGWLDLFFFYLEKKKKSHGNIAKRARGTLYTLNSPVISILPLFPYVSIYILLFLNVFI